MDNSNSPSSKAVAPTPAGNGRGAIGYAAFLLLLMGLEPMVVDAANDNDGQNAQYNRIDGCEKFEVMHASLLLLHLLRYPVPSPTWYVLDSIINAGLMQKMLPGKMPQHQDLRPPKGEGMRAGGRRLFAKAMPGRPAALISELGSQIGCSISVRGRRGERIDASAQVFPHAVHDFLEGIVKHGTKTGR